MARIPIDRKPIPRSAQLPDSLRVGSHPPQDRALPQYDGSSHFGRPNSNEQLPPYPVHEDELATPPSVPQRSSMRNSAEFDCPAEETTQNPWNGQPERRSEEEAQPIHPPEFAHLRAMSDENLQQRMRGLHIESMEPLNMRKGEHGPSPAYEPTLEPLDSVRSRDGPLSDYQPTPEPYYGPQRQHGQEASNLQSQNTGSTNPWASSVPESGVCHAPLHQKHERKDTADSANDAWAYEAMSNQNTGAAQPIELPAPAGTPTGAAHTNEPDWRSQPAVVYHGADAVANGGAGPGEDRDSPDWGSQGFATPKSEAGAGSGGFVVSPGVPSKGVTGAVTPAVEQDSESANPWSGGEARRDEAGPSSQLPRVSIDASDMRDDGGWEEMDRGPEKPTGEQQSGVIGLGGEEQLIELEIPESRPRLPPRPAAGSGGNGEDDLITDWAPAIPPRSSTEAQGDENPPAQPPRQQQSTQNQQQRGHDGNDVYNIKSITWYDTNSTHNPRSSPILTQNANGPCPLLALVNALVLSTKQGDDNEIEHAMRGKEQISLDTLLNGIINELLSEKNCAKEAAEGKEEFPDIGELHEFLKRLATGMNVNPRFIPDTVARSPEGLRNSMSHQHPAERSESQIPGGFEQTKELELYGTFGVRLLHGWLPEPGSAAYESFQRQARNHEDAQILLLREDELETKLTTAGENAMPEDEAIQLQDIYTISSFLTANPTQLSPFGLSTIQRCLRNGEFGILFRNSHFLTVYKHPHLEALFCLMTDEGYREREEVVWESLDDVDGGGMEIFDGGFNLISGPNGHNQSGRSPLGSLREEGRQGRLSGDGVLADEIAERERREREDADMAFAMSMQEEFDTAEEARRRREAELSEEFIRRSEDTNTLPIHRPEGGRGGRRARVSEDTSSSSGRGTGTGPSHGPATPARSSMLAPGAPIAPSPATRRPQSASNPLNLVTPQPGIVPIPGVTGPPSVASVAGSTAGGTGQMGAVETPIPASLLQNQRPVDLEAGVDNPPPTYDEAASAPRYEGPVEGPQGERGPVVAEGVLREVSGGLERADMQGGGVSAGVGGGMGVPGVGVGVGGAQGYRGQSLRSAISEGIAQGREALSHAQAARRVQEVRNGAAMTPAEREWARREQNSRNQEAMRRDTDCIVM